MNRDIKPISLSSITISGLKSIDSRGQTIQLTPSTVLLGANGSGKSNLLSAFALLRAASHDKLDAYVGRYRAQRLLHYGSKHTQEIQIKLVFDLSQRILTHILSLSYKLPDSLFPYSGLVGQRIEVRQDLERINDILRDIYVYQFHDTSDLTDQATRLHPRRKSPQARRL
jgi:predicted ATPase